MKKRTTIQVSQDCKDRLAALGSKGDTYEDILMRLMERIYIWDNVHITSIPFETKNGIQYMDLIIPKTFSMEIPTSAFKDAILQVAEENDITIIDDEN